MVALMSRQKGKLLKMSPAPKEPDLSSYSGRFAARLRTLREKTGMTGEEAAIAVSKSGYEVLKRSYYNWESGVSTPSLDAFPAIAKAFGIKRVRDLLPTD